MGLREKKEGKMDEPRSQEVNGQLSSHSADRRNRRKRSSFKGVDEQGRRSTHKRPRLSDNDNGAKRAEYERGFEVESGSGQKA